MKNYTDIKRAHQKELNEFPGLFFAFNKEQLKEGMEKVGASPENKIVNIGMGGYLLKGRFEEFTATLERHKSERREIKKNRKLLLESLTYELKNHEYCITFDPEPALEALGLNIEDIPKDILKKALGIASQDT
jgi:hypothetical protein